MRILVSGALVCHEPKVRAVSGNRCGEKLGGGGGRKGAAGLVSLLRFVFMDKVDLKPKSDAFYSSLVLLLALLLVLCFFFLSTLQKLTWSDASLGNLRADVTFTSCYRLQLTHSVQSWAATRPLHVMGWCAEGKPTQTMFSSKNLISKLQHFLFSNHTIN